ncbi:hypothetical protein EDB87DRAFT_1594670 [Lactarius vividus]|nr:hypothetical protein EDB87DRAFT_1594670 [Lactarius vividus]
MRVFRHGLPSCIQTRTPLWLGFPVMSKSAGFDPAICPFMKHQVHEPDLATANFSITMSAHIIDDSCGPMIKQLFPTLLLYDEGLRIHDELIVRANDYYLFPAEENLLKSLWCTNGTVCSTG